MWFSWRHIWSGTVDCGAFVYWFSSFFLDPSALEAFRIHSQDVQFACVAWCWWVVKLLLDIAVVKGKGKVTRRITSDGHCMCLCVCRLTTQTCGSYAKGSPLPNGVLLVCFSAIVPKQKSSITTPGLSMLKTPFVSSSLMPRAPMSDMLKSRPKGTPQHFHSSMVTSTPILSTLHGRGSPYRRTTALSLRLHLIAGRLPLPLSRMSSDPRT